MKNGKTSINQFIALNMHNVVVTEEGCIFQDKPIFAEPYIVDARHALYLQNKSCKGFFALPIWQNRIRFYNPFASAFPIYWDTKINSTPKKLAKN